MMARQKLPKTTRGKTLEGKQTYKGTHLYLGDSDKNYNNKINNNNNNNKKNTFVGNYNYLLLLLHFDSSVLYV